VLDERLRAIKHELSILASKKSAWIIKWTEECPTEWRPTTVIDPRSGEFFTPPGALDFVTEKLKEESTEIKEVPLDKPKGKFGYAFCVETNWGAIYIKVQFGNGGKIIGRSFHY
jgi:hypothetical protein